MTEHRHTIGNMEILETEKPKKKRIKGLCE